MGSIKENCPNCQKVASESYRCGYEQAMNIYKEAVMNCELQRPVVIEAPANSVLVDKINSQQQINTAIALLKKLKFDIEHNHNIDGVPWVEAINAVIAQLQ